jgi:hypothetical protein
MLFVSHQYRVTLRDYRKRAKEAKNKKDQPPTDHDVRASTTASKKPKLRG